MIIMADITNIVPPEIGIGFLWLFLWFGISRSLYLINKTFIMYEIKNKTTTYNIKNKIYFLKSIFKRKKLFKLILEL